MENICSPKIRFPFISTRITTDIVLFFALLPLWVILGITQFLGIFLMIFLFFKLLIINLKHQREVKIPFSLLSVMTAFLLSSLISGLHIQEEKWNLVFIRNFLAYLGALALFLVIININKDKKDLIKIIQGLNLMIFLACLIGLFTLLDIIPLKTNFIAPVAYFLPENIKQSEFLQNIVNPNFGDYIRIKLFNIKVKRISSIFPFPNTFAAAMIIILPFQFYLFKISRGRGRALTLLNIILVLISLFFTYSRSAYLALLSGFLYLEFKNVKKFLTFLQKPIIIFSAILIIFLFFLILKDPLLELKSRSTSTRMLIYEKTIESWKENPIFGWGTHRNMEVVGESPKLPPLGSHSYFLAILYRYGIFGSILFSIIIILILRDIQKISILRGNDPFLGKLGLYAGMAFFMNLIQWVFIVMDYDVILLFLIWMNWGIIVGIRMKLEKDYMLKKSKININFVSP